MLMAYCAGGDVQDRSLLSTCPPVGRIGKREPEERIFHPIFLLDPSNPAVSGSQNGPVFPNNPACLCVGEANAQQIGQLRAGSKAGQRAIDPPLASVDSLEHGAGVAHSPSIQWHP